MQLNICAGRIFLSCKRDFHGEIKEQQTYLFYSAEEKRKKEERERAKTVVLPM